MLESALVLFSGGQDSTVCLASALERFRHVETIGFDYGQRHSLEMDARLTVRKNLIRIKDSWAGRLGPDHVMELTEFARVSDTALTREREIEFSESGLPSTTFLLTGQ